MASLGAVESLMHRRLLERIPLRIHVNGTRGKSSVTRLIAAGLRAGGIRTCAKTTGTLPRMIFPDGTECPVFRPAKANVIEQRRVVRAAAARQAQAIVVECMALQPALQTLCELKLVRATHGVITNVRADHLDVMGPTVTDVAKALAGSTPLNGRLYTAEQRELAVLQAACRDRNSRLIVVGSDEVARVNRDDLAGFSHIEHPDNVALALRVCQDVGVDHPTALAGMWGAPPDPGAMTFYQVQERARQFVFVNAFAANDPESTGQNWNMLVEQFCWAERRIAVLNCRADRPDRSIQLAEACTQWRPADHYLLIGTGTEFFVRGARSAGLARDRLTAAEHADTERLIDELCGLVPRSAIVVGMGNISGPGMALVEFFRSRQAPAPAARMQLQEAA